MILRSNTGLQKFSSIKLYRMDEVRHAENRVLVIMPVDKECDSNAVRVDINSMDSLIIGGLTSDDVIKLIENAYTDDKIDLSSLDVKRVDKAALIPETGRFIGEWNKVIPYKNGWSPFVDNLLQVVIINTETGETTVTPDIDMGLNQLQSIVDDNAVQEDDDDDEIDIDVDDNDYDDDYYDDDDEIDVDDE